MRLRLTDLVPVAQRRPHAARVPGVVLLRQRSARRLVRALYRLVYGGAAVKRASERLRRFVRDAAAQYRRAQTVRLRATAEQLAP